LSQRVGDTLYDVLTAILAELQTPMASQNPYFNTEPLPSIPKVYQIADVTGAGASWSLPVPNSVTWKIRAIHSNLVADSNAGNRYHEFWLTDAAGNIIYEVTGPQTVAASATLHSTWSEGASTSSLVATGSTPIYQSMGITAVVLDSMYVKAINCGASAVGASDSLQKNFIIVDEFPKQGTYTNASSQPAPGVSSTNSYFAPSSPPGNASNVVAPSSTPPAPTTTTVNPQPIRPGQKGFPY